MSPDLERAARRRRRRWWILGPLLFLLLAGVLGALVVPLPYVALAPGSVRRVEELILVNGPENHPPAGNIVFTTVSLRRVTLAQALSGWLDPAVDVMPEDDILGDRSADENRQLNLALMDTSKLVATQVAFEELGYPVTVSGTGARVVALAEGKPAADVVEVGDVITAVDGAPIELSDDLVGVIGAQQPGDRISLTVEPAGGGSAHQADVTLAEDPTSPGNSLLGVQVQTRDLSFDFAHDVVIDSGSVGGPSAGLAFTLGVLDVLTPGELTGGETVAVTGTIDSEGRIGPVGGIAQKTAAVGQAGIDVFLVPGHEYEEALEHAGDGLRIARVDTLDDALEVLATLGGNALALGTPGAEGPGGA